MNQLGFKICILDDNLFFKRFVTGQPIIVGTYVDDIMSSFHPDDREEFMEFAHAMESDLLKNNWKTGSHIGNQIKIWYQ